MLDGMLECWGPNSKGEVGVGDTEPRMAPTPVVGLNNVVAASSGGEFTCAVREDGSAYCWGANDSGQLGTGDMLERHGPDVRVKNVPRLKGIAAGEAHACGLGDDGFVYCWGDDGADQLGFEEHLEVPNPIPRKVDGVSDVVDVTAGTWDTCALKRDHTVWCWGENSLGALGAGFSSEESAKPLQVQFEGVDN
jgi:hypothetical protein